MRTLFFKKIILVITISSLIFGGSEGILAPKVKAQGPATPGEAVGQALAAGASCFLATKLEIFATGLVSKAAKVPEGHANIGLYPEAVPVTDVSAPGETSKLETSDAFIKSKDCIRDVVVKMILDWVVDETVEWIQGGGQPRYVTNWDTFLSDAFNVGVGEIISESNLKFLCKPFGLQVRISLLPVPRFKNRIECTLDDIVANIEDFYNDFRNGSWIAYEASWQPQNNYYGTLYMTMDEAMISGARQKEAAEKKAMAGQGILPVEECEKGVPLINDTEENRRIMAEKGYIRDFKGNYCLPQEMKTVTPGSMVGAVTAKALTSDIEWAANVKSWTAALVNATINRLIKEGLGAMKKSTAPKSAGYGDYDPYGGYDPALSLKRQERDRIRGEYQNFLVYFDAILANKKSSLSSEEQLVVNLNELKKRNCQPPVSDADITAAQNEVTRLTDEVASYQAVINETNANITEAKNISENFRDREMTLLTQKYSDFLTKYQSYITEITSGSETTKKSSQEESLAKQNELSSTQSRLTICIATQIP